MSESSRPLINKTEMAEVLGVSLPTLDSWIRKKGDRFPVVQRGRNGVEWQLDAEEVIAFIRAEKDAAAAAGAARDDVVDQFKLPLLADSEKGVSPADLVRLANLRRLDREEAKERGFLVPTSEVRADMHDALNRLRRSINNAVQQVLRDHNTHEPTILSVMARVEEAERQCVNELQRYLLNEDGPPTDAELQPALL